MFYLEHVPTCWLVSARYWCEGSSWWCCSTSRDAIRSVLAMKMKGQYDENCFFFWKHFLWKRFSLSFSPHVLKKCEQKHANISFQLISVCLTFWVFSELHYSFVRSSFRIMCRGSYEFPKDSEKRRDYFLWNGTFIPSEVYPEIVKE